MDEFTKQLLYLIVGAILGGIVAWKIALLQIAESKNQESSKRIRSCVHNIMKIKEEIFNKGDILNRNDEFIIKSYSDINKLQKKWSNCCKELYILKYKIIYLALILKVKQNSIVKARLFSIVKKQKNIRTYLLPS